MAEGAGGGDLEIVDPGMLSTVQDLGRPGYAHLGVPRSGALDLPAHRLANRLVGNPEKAASLETTATGITVRLHRAATLAVTGATCPVRVSGRPAAWGCAVSVPAGALVELGPATRGLRSHLAVAGGLEPPAVLGSRSTDLLGGLGPAPLRAGDRLPLGRPVAVPSGHEAVPPTPVPTELWLLPGPRLDWCAAGALEGRECTVSASSNRIGLRLDADPVPRRPGELPSEGMVLGAVQLPPDGQPVILLADHATTGGYPVVAVVPTSQLAGCAQLRPGDRLTLRMARPGR